MASCSAASPSAPPLGVLLAETSKAVSQAFDAALQKAGGSRPSWLVLMALKRAPTASQREIAAAVNIDGATLTHHLNGMEADGLIIRRRSAGDRRVHVVDLTADGEAMFGRLVGVSRRFDERLRAGVGDDEAAVVVEVLGRLRANVTGDGSPS